MKNVSVLAVYLLCLGAFPLSGQENADQDGAVSLMAIPSYSIPTVSYLAGGLSSQLAALLRLGASPLYLDAAATYVQAASQEIETNATVSTVSLEAGGGLRGPLFASISGRIGGRVGYGNATMETDSASESGGAVHWSVVGGLDIPIVSRITATAQASLSAQLNTHFAIDFGLGIMWTPGPITFPAREERSPRDTRPEPLTADAGDAERGPDSPEDARDTSGDTRSPIVLNETIDYTSTDVHLLDAGFGTVFPVFYRFYDDNPVGSARIVNTGRRAIENLDVSVNIPRFMDLPQRQPVPSTLEAGEEIVIDLSVLFNDSLLDVTEGTRVAAQIAVSYETRGDPESYQIDTSLEVANRNAMTWDDDRKAASFVTARDPSVLSFARGVAGMVRTSGRDAINGNLRTGMALLEALNLHGIRYVIDPTTPYAELAEDAHAIDFLQFPVQTMEYGAGDCDDLSICYISHLEAVGIPAAFITVPGHIFTAFNTGVPANRISSTFPREDDVIVFEGQGWIPVEVTILDQGFLEAWEIGARQWREHEARGAAQLIPIQRAWEAFEPIGFDRDSRRELTLPPEADLLRAYVVQLESFITTAIEPQVARIEERIESGGPSARLYNRLGVLYANYAMVDEAQLWLNRALELEPSAHAYLNVGHLSYLEGEFREALQYYRQAESLDPQDEAILLAVCRANHELENYQDAVAYYQQLETASPDLAEQFSYLAYRGSDAGRASDAATMQSVIIWGEDPK